MLTARLFHGRTSVHEQLKHWGQDGPVLGPLDSVHLTFGELRLTTVQGEDVELRRINGLLFYGGVLYGDVEIGHDFQPTEQVDPARAEPPATLVVEWCAIPVHTEDRAPFFAALEVFTDRLRELTHDGVSSSVQQVLATRLTERRSSR